MKKTGKYILIGLIILVLISGCAKELSPHEKGEIIFNLKEITITHELEVKELFVDETKMIGSMKTKFVIIPIKIENKQNKWLRVQVTPGFNGLIDEQGNRYQEETFFTINERTYSVDELIIIADEEVAPNAISPNSIEIRKFVFIIPNDREPRELSLSYGNSASKEAEVEDWFEIRFDLSL